MLAINLLPPQQIKAREEKEYTRKIVLAFIFCFIILAISFSLLFILQQTIQKSFLNSQQQELAAFEKYFNQEKNKKIEQEVENINKILSRVSTIEENKTRWSNTLIELTKITPENLYFSSLKINKQEKKIEIMGLAKTREGLLKFQDNLEKSEYFENVTSPISNIISPENINFTIEARLTDKL